MNILCDGDWERPEIEISDSISGLIKLGNVLTSVDSEVEILSEQKKSQFYSENLNGLLLKKTLKPKDNDTLNIVIVDKKLVFEGSDIALSKLGMSLLDFFDEESQEGKHLHLNYFPGNGILSPTKCELIIVFRN
jgi:hypothetical protein